MKKSCNFNWKGGGVVFQFDDKRWVGDGDLC